MDVVRIRRRNQTESNEPINSIILLCIGQNSVPELPLYQHIHPLIILRWFIQWRQSINEMATIPQIWSCIIDYIYYDGYEAQLLGNWTGMLHKIGCRSTNMYCELIICSSYQQDAQTDPFFSYSDLNSCCMTDTEDVMDLANK